MTVSRLRGAGGESHDVATESPTRTSSGSAADLFTYGAFPPAFAAFLRQNPGYWRLRRVDRFRPIDTNLALHRATLQCRIDPALLDRFLDLYEDDLDLPETTYGGGDELTVYVPVMRFPKRLLLDFTTADDAGKSIQLLTRTEDSSVAASFIISLLVEGLDRELRDREVVALHVILSTLIAQNPHDLEDRINEWVRERCAKGEDRRYSPENPLRPRDLSAWIHDEGEDFQPGLGTALQAALAPLLWAAAIDRPQRYMPGDAEADRVGALDVPDPRQGGLKHLPSMSYVLLHAVHDLLRMSVEFAPSWSDDENTQPEDGNHVLQSDLMADPLLLIRHLQHNVLPGIRVLRELLRGPRRGDALPDLLRDLDSWTAYVVKDIRLGVPFSITFTQTLPLRTEDLKWPRPVRWIEGRWRTVWRSNHRYPIPLKDAPSMHVEVDVPDPELRIPLKPGYPPKRLGILVWIPGKRETYLDKPLDAFDAEARPSDRIVHFYSSRRAEESRRLDDLAPYVHLYVPIRLTFGVLFGYLAASVAFVLAAIFVGWEAFPTIVTAERPPLLLETVEVAILSVTLSLFLVSTQHPSPLVTRKILGARLAFAVSIATILAAVSTLMFSYFYYDGLPSKPSHANDQGRPVLIIRRAPNLGG